MGLRNVFGTSFGVAAHVIFFPIGAPSVLIFYCIPKSWRPKSCCPCHDFLVFELVYFWPIWILLTPLTIPSLIRILRQEKRDKAVEKEFEEWKMRMIPIIRAHHQKIGFQTDYPENVVEILVTDTLDYLEKGKIDAVSYDWAARTVRGLKSCKIEGIDEILRDCEEAWRIVKN